MAFRPAPLLLLPALLQAQAGVGRLYYATLAGRAVAFRIVEAGPGRMTLAPETGDAARLRGFVLEHAGPEALKAAGAKAVPDLVPAGWKGGTGATALIQTGATTFWRHAPGQVLPVRFQAGGQAWTLLAADLPPGRSF